MKTIRANCFETNSSSTHSVTIQSKSRIKRDDKQLVVDGVLHPENLRSTSAYRNDNRDGHSLHAETKDQKAALFIHHLKSVEDYSEWDSVVVSGIFKYVIEQLIAQCGYTGINTKFNYNFPYSNEEEGGTYIDNIFDDEDPQGQVLAHIHGVILNDDMIIIDMDSAY